jgi:hypothetical protein
VRGLQPAQGRLARLTCRARQWRRGRVWHPGRTCHGDGADARPMSHCCPRASRIRRRSTTSIAPTSIRPPTGIRWRDPRLPLAASAGLVCGFRRRHRRSGVGPAGHGAPGGRAVGPPAQPRPRSHPARLRPPAGGDVGGLPGVRDRGGGRAWRRHAGAAGATADRRVVRLAGAGRGPAEVRSPRGRARRRGRAGIAGARRPRQYGVTLPSGGHATMSGCP